MEMVFLNLRTRDKENSSSEFDSGIMKNFRHTFSNPMSSYNLVLAPYYAFEDK